MKKIIISIDGYSSCGKSTFAKAIAAKLGYNFIDTGAMYRTITLYSIEKGYITCSGVDVDAIISSLNELNISLKFNFTRGASDIYLNGENVETKIRTIEVSSYVSAVSSIKEVRTKLVAFQQKIGANKGIVMDGRDIGTTVFPTAELKIFMTASVDIRAERRYNELRDKGDNVTYDEIKGNISARDYQDETRTESPLKRADDAIVLDNTHMSVEQQMEWVMGLIDKIA